MRCYNLLEVCEITASCRQSQLAVGMCQRLISPNKATRTTRIIIEIVDVARQIRCMNGTLLCVSIIPICAVADGICQADKGNGDLSELKIIRRNQMSSRISLTMFNKI